MSGAINPYAAPSAPVDDVPANPEAEAIRRAHINHEASIKAVGFLYYLGGVLLTVAGLASLLGARQAASGTAIMLLLTVLGVAQLFAGWGVRALRPWGQIVGCVLSAIGLLGFPIGRVAMILFVVLVLLGHVHMTMRNKRSLTE